jgi:hypothetical protein
MELPPTPNPPNGTGATPGCETFALVACYCPFCFVASAHLGGGGPQAFRGPRVAGLGPEALGQGRRGRRARRRCLVGPEPLPVQAAQELGALGVGFREVRVELGVVEELRVGQGRQHRW